MSASIAVSPRASAQPAHVVDFPENFIVRDGLCYVPSYQTTRKVNVKERWRERPLSQVLIEEFRLTAKYIEQAVTVGKLLVNHCPCDSQDLLHNGDVITHTYAMEEPAIHSEAIVVLAENTHVLVVQKPRGMPCHPQGKFHRASLTEILRSSHLKVPDAYLHPVNRLDRLTSGVVLLAKTRKAYMLLARELPEMQKIYVARVRGAFSAEAVRQAAHPMLQAEGTHLEFRSNENVDLRTAAAAVDGVHSDGFDVACHLPLKVERHQPNQPLMTQVDLAAGQPASSFFNKIRDYEDSTSLVQCRLLHGRTHQIRVHLNALGFPIVGDPIYGAAVPPSEIESDVLPDLPMCLHAALYAVRLDASLDPVEALQEVLPAGEEDAQLPGMRVYRSRRPVWAD